MTQSEPTLIEKLRLLPREKLLHMRAAGDEVGDEWHDAIEAIYIERGENLPPRPAESIIIKPKRESMKGDVLVSIGALIAAMILGEIIQQSLLIPAAVLFLTYLIIKFVRLGSMTHEERAAEKAESDAAKLGMNELMRCAADGKLARATELLNYKAMDINARSTSGATALVYAAFNGHADLVRFLVDRGADKTLLTNKGQSAAALARKYGHDAISDQLESVA